MSSRCTLGRARSDQSGPDAPARPWGLSVRGEGTWASPHGIDSLGRAKRRVVGCHDQAESGATTGTKVSRACNTACSSRALPPPTNNKSPRNHGGFRWWPGADLNRRHGDFQSQMGDLARQTAIGNNLILKVNVTVALSGTVA